MLELFDVADVAAELRALVHLHVLLQLVDSLPIYLRVKLPLFASVWELAKLHDVSNDGVDFSKEVAPGVAAGANACLLRCNGSLSASTLHLLHLAVILRRVSLELWINDTASGGTGHHLLLLG